jgi:hypothetical protein
LNISRPVEALALDSNRPSSIESTSKEEAVVVAAVGRDHQEKEKKQFLVSPNGKSLLLKSKGTGASQKKVSLRKRMTLFEEKKSADPSSQGNKTAVDDKENSRPALDYEVENTSQFGSCIIIKSHRV